MTEKEALDQIEAGFTQVDAASTQIGVGLTAASAYIADLKQQIAASDNLAQAQAIAERFGAVITNLDAQAAAATALAGTSSNPVPVPVPDPITV